MEQGFPIDIEDLLKCSICLDIFVEPITFICQHSFCTNCIIGIKNNKCPLCKHLIVIPLQRNIIMDYMSKILFEKKYDEKINSIKTETSLLIPKPITNENLEISNEHSDCIFKVLSSCFVMVYDTMTYKAIWLPNGDYHITVIYVHNNFRFNFDFSYILMCCSSI